MNPLISGSVLLCWSASSSVDIALLQASCRTCDSMA